MEGEDQFVVVVMGTFVQVLDVYGPFETQRGAEHLALDLRRRGTERDAISIVALVREQNMDGAAGWSEAEEAAHVAAVLNARNRPLDPGEAA